MEVDAAIKRADGEMRLRVIAAEDGRVDAGIVLEGRHFGIVLGSGYQGDARHRAGGE